MIQKLLAYQETDKKLKDIEVKLNTSEDKKQAYVAYKYISGVGEMIAKIDKKAEELGAKYAELKSKEASLCEELNEISADADTFTDEEEVLYMMKKIDELNSAMKKLEGEISAIETTVYSIKKEYDHIKINTKKMQESYKEHSNAYNKLKKEHEEEIKTIKAELEACKQGIDEDLMNKYLDKRKDKNFPILVPVNEKRCTACGMDLSIKDMSNLDSGKIIECEHCGRLLYK